MRNNSHDRVRAPTAIRASMNKFQLPRITFDLRGNRLIQKE